jgi:hypothetical protein
MSDTNLYKCHTYDGGGTLNFVDVCQTVFTSPNALEMMSWAILRNEFGPKTAQKFTEKFAEYLTSRSTPEFILTSGLIAFIINRLERNEYSSKA